MTTTVLIPQPIRADVDHEVSPHVFAEVTDALMTRVEWNADGLLEVDFDADLTEDQVNDVVRIARQQPMLFDPGGPQLPTPIIPGVEVGPDGELIWTGGTYIDLLKSGYLNADMAVAGKVWVAQWADPEDPDSGPAENSAVIEMIPGGKSDEADPDDGDEPGGFSVWSPQIDPATGQFVYVPSDPTDPTSEPVQDRRRTVHFPAAEYTYNETTGQYDHVAATFDGDVYARIMYVLGELNILARAHLGTGAKIQLDNVVGDPAEQPRVSFGPISRRWPATAQGRIDVGFGHHNGMYVTGMLDYDKGGDFYNIRARFVDADTGYLDHDVQLNLPFKRVAGFTCTGGYIYVLGRFTTVSDPWTIVRFNPTTGFGDVNTFVNVDAYMGAGYNTGGLGDANRNDAVAFAFRDNNDELGVRYYNLALNAHPTLTNRNNLAVTTSRAIVGVPEVDVIAAGSKFFWFDSGAYNADKSWTTGVGPMSGAQYIAGTGFVSTHSDGTLKVYNDAMTTSPWAWFSQTYARTTPAPFAQTAQSDKLNVRWPTRKFATVQVSSPVPGTTDTYLYVGTGATEPVLENMWRATKPAGAVQVLLAGAPTTGDNPPLQSTFNATDPGVVPAEITSQALIPGTSQSALSIKANGEARLYGHVKPFMARYLSSNVTIPPGSQTDIGLDGLAEADATGCITYNLATGVYTVAWPGLYRIEAQLSWANATGGYRTLIVYVNGNQVANSVSTGGTYTSCVVARTLRLVAGDQIKVGGFQTSGSGLDARGSASANQTFMTIERNSA